MENTQGNDALPVPGHLRLRGFERQAVQGLKLGPQDRLRAAFHLTRAWHAANSAGLRKEDFQDLVFAELTRPHASRKEFRLANWTLRRGEDPRAEDLRPAYDGRSTPQRGLEPYLAGVTVAARHCGIDPDQWKLEMLRDLSLWSRGPVAPDVLPADDRPAETLALLMGAMCAALGRRNRLQDVFDAISSMNCRWEMFGERLLATDAACMTDRTSGDGAYFEEMFPVPSISLLRVPYLCVDTCFLLAPEAGLSAAADDAVPMLANLFPHVPVQPIPDDAPGRIKVDGQLGWYRDIRLCILPDGHGGYKAGLETRPVVEVALKEWGGHPGGPHRVYGGYEPALRRPLYYARTASGGPVWPHVFGADGKAWRICTADGAEDPEDLVGRVDMRDPETTGWQFDPDPIAAPGEVFAEPWYLSYTPATPDYLRHWLTGDWQLGRLAGQCDWSRGNHPDWDDPESRWNRDLPPIRDLNFPGLNAATWVECCLHNGLVEEAMQASIDRLKTQAAALQAEWQMARDSRAQALLSRWSPSNDGKDAN